MGLLVKVTFMMTRDQNMILMDGWRSTATRRQWMDKTLLKGLEILGYVVKAKGSVRITDVAAELGLTKSNAYRTLRTLESAGYLTQDSSSKEFVPSMRIWEMGMAVGGRMDLKSRAAALLQALADESHETVHLAILDGTEVLYIDKIDSIEPVASYTRLAGRAPAHCVATGKAILSCSDDRVLEPVLNNLKRYSDHTITTKAEFKEALSEVRKRGFAINRGEWRDTVWGIAAPIFDLTGRPVASVGVSGPKYRIEAEDTLERLSHLVVAVSRGISEKLT